MYFTKKFQVGVPAGLALVAVAASISSVACTNSVDPSGSGGAGASEADASTGSSGGGEVGPLGTATGAIKVWVLVRNQPPISTEVGTTWIQLIVSDAKDKVLHNVDIEAMGDGQKIFFEGESFATLKTPISTFDLSVTHALGTRTGVHLVGPMTTTPTLSPPPALHAPTTLQWVPNNESGVATIGWTFVDIQSVWKSDTMADPGTMQLPGQAFPLSGSFNVGLLRTRTWTDGDALVAQFQSETTLPVVVPD